MIRGVIAAALLNLACAASAATATATADAKDPEDDLVARCAGAACHKVATAVPWPDVRLDEGTTPFNVQGAFSIRLPKAPLEFILHADGGFIARYPDRRWIGVQVVQAPADAIRRRVIEGDPRPGALRYADLPRIHYTKTPDDPEPSHPEDRELWRIGLVFKSSTFANATRLQYAERGPLAAYFADAGVGDTTGEIQVVHRRLSDEYLFVQLNGFTFDDVRRIVGSIESKRD